MIWTLVGGFVKVRSVLVVDFSSFLRFLG